MSKCQRCGDIVELVDTYRYACPNGCTDPLPNSGIKRSIGMYEINLTIYPSPNITKNIKLDGGCVAGYYISDLFDSLESDLTALKKIVGDFA